MSLPRWILPTLVLGVGLTVIGALGSGVISRDRDARRLAQIDARLEWATRWADGRSAAVQTRADELRQGSLEGVETWRHDPEHGLVPDRADSSEPTSADQLRFERSRRGGEAYLQRGEFGRAIDAFAFAIPELTHRGLADRLLLRVGRVSLERSAAEAESGPSLDRTVGERILRELAERPSTAVESGMPVEMLARLTLARHGVRDALPTRAELAQRFETLPVAVVETLARRLPAAGDDTLSEKLSRAHALDRAVREQRDRLRDGKARLVAASGSDRLIVPLDSDDGALSLAVADAPRDSAEREAIRVAGYTPQLRTPSLGSSDAASENTSIVPVVLDGEPVAHVSVLDPNDGAKRVEIARREASLRVGLYAVLIVVGAALLATWLAIDRQRRLAELKVRLLANVSHELKTPVTSIRMLGELLTDPQLPRERIEEFGQLVNREAKRLGRRIEDILETARGVGPGAALDLAPTDIVAVTREVIDGLAPRIEERGAEVSVHAETEQHLVPAETDALERVVENLVDNALKYGGGPDGSPPRVDVRIERAARETRLHVEDRGPGVPTDDRERIFDSFYRSAFEDYGVPGTGLGLAISRSLARRLGGQLVYTPLRERRKEGGSRFTLVLPDGPEELEPDRTKRPSAERDAEDRQPENPSRELDADPSPVLNADSNSSPTPTTPRRAR